jgi:adenylosuccinate lyase
VGAAPAQVQAVADRVAAIVARHPDAATYAPAPIL